MAFTRSSTAAGDDVAAPTVVGADSGTIIPDSVTHDDAQARESVMDYELDTNGTPSERPLVVVT